MDDATHKRIAIQDFETPGESTNPETQCERSEPTMPSQHTRLSSPSNPTKHGDEAKPRLVHININK